jgi:hypothetical protein
VVRSPYERRADIHSLYQGEGWVLRKPSAAQRARLVDRRENRAEEVEIKARDEW